MNQDLKDLIEVSRFYGIDKRAVIAGGGNTSLKTPDRLWIKASGHALGTIDEDGFAVLDREKLKLISSKDYSNEPFQREEEIKNDLMAANLTQDLRPSVETSLHDIIRYKFVVHLHPTLVNGLMCGTGVEKHISGIFGKEALYVPYTDPGYILFSKIEKKLLEYRKSSEKDPPVILLQNHGIFVGADTISDIRKIYDGIFETLGQFALDLPLQEYEEVDQELLDILPALRMRLSDEGLKTLRLRNSQLDEHFAASPENFKKISLPFTPDIIVYCKSRYIYLENKGTAEELADELNKRVDEFMDSNGYLPKVVLIRGLGLISAGENATDADTILDVFEDMMQIAWLSECFGGPHPMTPEQIRFIDTWEVENYRRKTAKGDSAGSPADKRNIIVTGAAMGFGAGIARGLYEKGANIVIADINEEAGNAVLEEFKALGRKNQAIFVKTDVSDPASLEELMAETVKAFGALDCYLSNAGILRAGGLDEMDEKTFDLVTKINYNAYFYGTKAASRIMRIQQEAVSGKTSKTLSGQSPVSRSTMEHFADIIQINSKSGLSGSKKNFAYAGGKFGGIGLTQSFALELAPYNIKVNSVCPGNFFEGPLWSDPENGLFVQYLNAGKVPGAKTIEDVRKHYESQVPLGRGCRVEDVVKAVLYILDQKYETGQAVPVTGGQTMLN
jgi:NAD(P)-dependent dehydrogenase (short-subunit alcohol dehydrogenase family)/rhamnose utilization protein RhaD (predicted bifunctional aldolase and dehydrogenase)